MPSLLKSQVIPSSSMMNSCSNDNSLSFSHVFHILLACNGEILNFIACEWLAKSFSNAERGLNWISHDSVEVLDHISVSIRVAVGKIHSVVWVLKVVAECMSEVSFRNTSFFRSSESIWIVTNVYSISMPANIFMSSHSFTVNENFHSFIVETIRFA